MIKLDNKQLLLIVLAIIIAGLIISVGCFYGLSQNKNTTNITNSDNATNTTDTINNTTDTTNDPIEHISNDEQVATQSSSKPQYIGEDGEPISEADYKTIQVYGKSANSPEEFEAQKASLGY